MEKLRRRDKSFLQVIVGAACTTYTNVLPTLMYYLYTNVVQVKRWLISRGLT